MGYPFFLAYIEIFIFFLIDNRHKLYDLYF